MKRIILVAMVSLILNTPFADAGNREHCSNEMQEMQYNFEQELSKKHFYEKTTSHPEKEKKFVAWLKNRHAYVVRHEEAHDRASGLWNGQIIYQTYNWRGVKYAHSGCQIAKNGEPLETIIKSALAPERPSNTDKRIAAKAKKHLEIKRARTKCRGKLPLGFSSQKVKNCQRAYKEYGWLDYYPATPEEAKLLGKLP